MTVTPSLEGARVPDRSRLLRENILDAILATPIVGGFYGHLQGMTLEEWVMVVSLVYTVLLAIHKAWQMTIPQTLWRWGRVIVRRLQGLRAP